MRNAIKLIIDKEEYVANTQDINLTVSNLSSLGVKNLYLTSSGLDRYPIKSINGNVVTIDSSIIPNNTSKCFMLYGEKELPKLEFSNLKTEYIRATDYTLDIIRGSWANSISSSVSGVYLEIVLGYDESLVYKFPTNLKSKISSSTIQAPVNFFNGRIPGGNNLFKFKIFSEDSSKNRTYYAESDFYTIEMTTNPYHDADKTLLYLYAEGLMLEANRTYKLLISSAIVYKSMYPNLLVECLSPFVQETVKCKIVDDCYLEFTMPDLSSKLSDGTTFNLTANFFKTQEEADNEVFSGDLFSFDSVCIYKNNTNSKHPLV